MNSDSKLRPRVPSLGYLKHYNINNTDLYEVLDESRVVKTAEEIKVMKYVCEISSEGHEEVLRKIGVGNKEY